MNLASTSINILALWVGLHMLLTLALALNVTRNRFKQAAGDLDDEALNRVVRAHGNNIEYVPFALVGLGVLALLGLEAWWVHGLAGTLFIARILHAHGIQQAGPGLPKSRVLGNVMTWLVFLIVAVTALILGLG
ncbi:MAG: MAPEG family protein [Pseudomonadota bacterium]